MSHHCGPSSFGPTQLFSYQLGYFYHVYCCDVRGISRGGAVMFEPPKNNTCVFFFKSFVAATSRPNNYNMKCLRDWWHHNFCRHFNFSFAGIFCFLLLSSWCIYYEWAKRTKFLLAVIYGSPRRHLNSSKTFKKDRKNWNTFLWPF